MLHVARIESNERRSRAPKRVVAQEIKCVAVPVVRTRPGDHVHDRAPSPARFRAIAARRHAKFLHYLVRKLVRRSISSHGLSEEAVIVVRAIDQETGVIATNAAVRKVAVRFRCQTSRILRNSGHQQQQIGEPASIEGKIPDGPIIH
jgi:hypothetical protein